MNIRNKKALLKKIEVMDSIQVLKFFEENFTRIGKGSSRNVYALNENWVIKIPHCEMGEMQNQQEHFINEMLDSHAPDSKGVFAKIYPSHNRFVIMERCGGSRKKQVLNFANTIRNFVLANRYHNKKVNSSRDAYKYQIADKMKVLNKKDKIIKQVLLLECSTDGCILGDICNQNLGIDSKNNVKFIDYGLTEFALEQYELSRRGGYGDHVQWAKEYFKPFVKC